MSGYGNGGWDGSGVSGDSPPTWSGEHMEPGGPDPKIGCVYVALIGIVVLVIVLAAIGNSVAGH